ncbi:hypothetical protein AMS68_000960 [Peltaster fructicola]|uniref:Peptidase M20 dimerisation domain-containing protein n=1 Tax=Peltaster fructicola TaxID=286661 RepID=A0A6H0XL48_9PEZI|nr:hypothetical protein AMS68_000960 [Peltaster fructicola]
MEKSALLGSSEPLQQAPITASRGRKIAAWTIIPLWFVLYITAYTPFASISHRHTPAINTKQHCAQVPALRPTEETDELKQIYDFVSSETFRNASVLRMSKAVQIATESFDDMGEIGQDKRWDVMYTFADYLEKTFPRVHNKLKVEKVNTHGLVYTWTGSDETAKPLLLMAHQDVVPVPKSTIQSWTHPPFSGFYDGKYIWGRGSSDCKNQLIATLETLELLLEARFQPSRTILLSFGFDEEVSGPQGAGHLAPFLLERYGKDGIAAIVDEGATFEKAWGVIMAKPGVAEKGYTDVYITVRMPGGHSSIPSDHTSIGVASEIITAIEAEQYPLELASDNPYLSQLYCGAEHAPDFPKKLKKLLAHSAEQCPASKKKHDPLAYEAAKAGPATKYLMQTSQAVDVITGGVKVNALPEKTVVTVNHRINIGSTPQVVFDRLERLVAPIAKKHGLGLNAFNSTEEAPETITLKAGLATLEVAPVTPTQIDSITPYFVLAGTVRALYGEDVLSVPGIMTGNTDTRYYWPLSKHIFRFGPGADPDGDAGLGNIHTVDERVSVVSHVNAVKWFMLFIRNMDEAKL